MQAPRDSLRILFLLALLLGGTLAGEAVAIVVAPTAVYMTQRTPSASVTLFNPGTVPEEVSVEVLFGFPETDDEGNLFLWLAEEGSDDPRSAADWIQAFPRRLVVPPGGRQVIRIMARPPDDLPEGEYWSRLAFTSVGQQVPVEGVPDTAAVRVGVDLRVRTVIAGTFRKGEVATGLRVEDFEPLILGDSLELAPRLVREGNGAYIGRMEVRLEDAGGNALREWEGQVAVYDELRRRLRYDVADLPPGSYRLRLSFSTDREDIPREHQLQGEAVEVVREVAKP
jgi:hypothetical protein